jgi:hypothetical protein
LRTEARSLKQAGTIPTTLDIPESTPDHAPPRLPRIRAKSPRKGYFHPALPRDIEDLLHFFGERYVYGLRAIELVSAAEATRRSPRPGRLAVATLRVPGTIILYAQAVPPWVLSGNLRPRDASRLTRAGAVLEILGHGHQTLVHWPGAALRDFLLFDGLMHELAHHTIQQYKGKRALRVARTADHEAFADHFAQNCRLRYLQRTRQDGPW